MTTDARTPLRLRHEIKSCISPAEDRAMSQRLARLFGRDPHAGPSGIYRVSSLYFDTPGDRALREKLNGTDRREKFRLRYYGEDTGFVRLEKKIKASGLCGKRSARLTAGQVQQLLAGDIGFLLESGDSLLIELYSKMQGQRLAPRRIVTYDREAFLWAPGNLRITLDRNLRAGMDLSRFLDPALPHIPMAPGQTVLEVKYDEFLPELARLAVQLPRGRAEAFSKYAACRRYD